MIYLNLFLTFFKIGIVTFGGGYAMIPLLTEEVLTNGWLTSEEVLNFIAVSESTPGPVAINMATFIGASQGGAVGSWGALFGAFCATLGVVTPSFIIILLIASVIKGLMKFGGVKAFISGVRPVVVALILGTALTVFISVVFSLETVYSAFSFDYKALIIFVMVAVTAIIAKKFFRKNLSPIILILVSAILGIIMYGLI